jgi:cobaltochelatase CobS
MNPIAIVKISNASWTEAQRNALRGLVRGAPGFAEWREANGIGPHMTRVTILEALRHFGLGEEAIRVFQSAKPSGAYGMSGNIVSTPENDGDADRDADRHNVAADDDVVSLADPVERDVANVLSPVRPFLADKLVEQIESVLRPIVAQAHKPAIVQVQTVEKVVERIVETPALSPMREGEARRATRIGQTTMAKAFSVGGASGKMSVQLWDDPLAPKPDQGYVLDGVRMFLAASSFEAGETVWLAGAAGTGKTTLAREYAARTGRGFTRIGFSRTTELVDLLGQKEPTPDGVSGAVKMVWTDGVFTQAIRRPGTVILLDELTAAPPGTAIAFQTILDERKVTLPTGEVVSFADGVVVSIADNTAGYGDESGVYAGTHSANAALVDRAARVVVVDYLPTMLEAEALQKRTSASQGACVRVAEFAAKVRNEAARNGGDSRPFSIRRLIAFMNATHRDGLKPADSWDITVLSRLPEADRETMRQAIRAHFDAVTYARELKGLPVDVASTTLSTMLPDREAAQNAAREAFDANQP